MKLAENRCRHQRIKLTAAAALVLAGVAATAGCAGQAVPTSDVSVAVPSAPSSSALQAPSTQAAQTSQASAASGATQTTKAAAAVASPTTAKTRSVSAAVKDCGQGAALTRPGALVLACADQGLWAKSLTWSNWSATSATATGVISWHVCTPNCAESTKWDTASAQFTLTDPVSEPGNEILFTKIVMHVTGPTPAGFTRDATFDMAPN